MNICESFEIVRLCAGSSFLLFEIGMFVDFFELSFQLCNHRMQPPFEVLSMLEYTLYL